MKSLLVLILALAWTATMGMNPPQDTTTTVSDTTEVACQGPDREMPCPRNYDPVCGCDEVTYSNACIAESAGVTDITPGACPGGCRGPVMKDAPCPLDENPVCGCDGVTYSNICMAVAGGALKYTPGACK